MNRKLQREIIARDGVCRICSSEKHLHVHHINEIVEGKWLSAYVTEVPELLVTLCSTCHGHLHGKGGGRLKWSYRRKLIQAVFNVDVGICERHQWVCPGEVTYCRNCLMLKTGFDLRQKYDRKYTMFPVTKSPIEKVRP